MNRKRFRRMSLGFFEPRPDAEIDDEVAFHIEQRVRDYMASGLDEEAARAAARERFGDVESVRRECAQLLRAERRAEARRDWFGDLMQDIRFGARAALASPAFTLMAVVTLALGTGANAAAFGVIKSVLLDSLPYSDGDRLVRIYSQFGSADTERSSVSPGAFVDLAERLQTLTDVSAFRFGTFDVAYVGDAAPRVLSGAMVDAEFFNSLGVGLSSGRPFTETDEALSVVMLSHALWQRELGADPEVIGRTLHISGGSYEVVGILPRGFVGPMGDADVWFRLDLDPVLANPVSARDQHYLGVIGRLAPGRTLDAVRSELDGLSDQLAREHPGTDSGRDFLALPLREAMAGETRTPLLLLMASAALVLLVTCANLAGALLTRTIARRREFAVRLALGAGRSRLVRQLLTETAVLALIGAGAGILLAIAGLEALRALALPVLPAYADLSLDAGAVAVTLLVAFTTAVGFGTVPALAASGWEPQGALREGGRGAMEGRRSRHLRGALLAAQIAVSLSLLTGAGLLVRSLWTMTSAPLGFEPDGALTGTVQLHAMRYQMPEARIRFFDELHARLAALPGVQDVAMASQLPSADMTRNALAIEGVTFESDGPIFIQYTSVSDEYFRTMQTPIRSGRTFDARDHQDGTPSIVISEAMARRYWPSGDAIGARIRISPQTAERWGVIIGVVADLRSDPALPHPEPMAYASIRQDPWRTGRAFVVRTQQDPAALIAPFQQELAALDPEMPLRNAKTLRAWIDERLVTRRLPVLLMTAFGALTLVLTSVGIYAMFASLATSREPEFGIRMALGSTPRAIGALVLRQGGLWMAWGFAGGLVGVAFVASLLRNLLFQIEPLDPIALAMALLALGASATIALLVPVRRATRVDPITAMRV
jgi:putative ABC transport system permease protein